MSKNPINKTLIKQTIKVTQAIEGYGQADSDTVKEVQKLREQYGIKVSTKK